MNKIRVVFLCRNREAIVKYFNPTKEIEFQRGLYVISEDRVSNWVDKEIVRGSEIIFFQDDFMGLKLEEDQTPNPSNDPQEGDHISVLDEYIYENILEQTSKEPRDFSKMFEKLSFLKHPLNWIWILFLGAILYSVFIGGVDWRSILRLF